VEHYRAVVNVDTKAAADPKAAVELTAAVTRRP